jgi:hypothetical protein
MILAVLQFAAVAFIALFLGWCRLSAHRRNNRTWESLIARLRHDWNARELSDRFPWKEGLGASPDEIWTRIGGARGLRAMYENATVMLEMANFAARNGEVDAELLANLHADATAIRFSVMRLLAQYALNQASENVRVRTFQVASMYTGMTARMTQLLQDHASMALPQFVAAM